MKLWRKSVVGQNWFWTSAAPLTSWEVRTRLSPQSSSVGRMITATSRSPSEVKKQQMLRKYEPLYSHHHHHHAVCAQIACHLGEWRTAKRNCFIMHDCKREAGSLSSACLWVNCEKRKPQGLQGLACREFVCRGLGCKRVWNIPKWTGYPHAPCRWDLVHVGNCTFFPWATGALRTRMEVCDSLGRGSRRGNVQWLPACQGPMKQAIYVLGQNGRDVWKKLALDP